VATAHVFSAIVIKQGFCWTSLKTTNLCAENLFNLLGFVDVDVVYFSERVRELFGNPCLETPPTQAA